MRLLWWDTWFFAVLCGVAFFGFLALIIAAPLWQVLDMPWLGLGALIMPICAVVGFVIVRSSKTLLGFTNVAAIVLVGFLVTVLAGNLMRGCNAWLDGSKGKTYTVPVHGVVRKQKGLRQRIVVESWRVPGGREEVYVPDELYEVPPARVIVTTRDGFFGWTWVGSVKPVP